MAADYGPDGYGKPATGPEAKAVLDKFFRQDGEVEHDPAMLEVIGEHIKNRKPFWRK